LARWFVRLLVVAMVLLAVRQAASQPAWSGAAEGVVVLGRVSAERLDALGPVWYYQYGFAGDDIGDHRRIMLIRPHTRTDELSSAMGQRRDAVWLVGNEPNDPNQDAMSPCAYARFYRWAEDVASRSDWGARLVPAGIADADIAYAEAFLACYRRLYGREPRVAAWNIHNYILDEGASQYDVRTFQERIVAFRDWMDDIGHGGLPLLLTEYGVLYGSGCCDHPAEPPEPGVAFLAATTRWLQQTDHVQAWAWFCLDSRGGSGASQFNGDLLSPEGALSPFGQAYQRTIAERYGRE